MRRSRSLAALPVQDRGERFAVGRRLVCVVPMFQETDLAEETVRFWRQLLRRQALDAVVLVTTAKESEGAGPTTHTVLRQALRDDPAEKGTLVLLHCQEPFPYRAAQLDLAVEWAREQFSPAAQVNDLWIGVYNADSRPQDETFGELRAQIAAAPGVRLFQQLVDYVVPDRPGSGRVACGNAVLQTWWTLSHYVSRNTHGRPGDSLWSRTVPYSTFGHGEFIRSDFLDLIGGFPRYAYADGLLLGWVARLAGEPIGLLVSRDIAEVPRTAHDLVLQQTAWLRGLLNFSITARWCRARGLLRLSEWEVRLLRLRHLVIPVAWGISTAVVTAGLAVEVHRVIRGRSAAHDLATVATLAVYPVLPGLVATTAQQHATSPVRRVAGVLASWPVEGLAFWPALDGHLRRGRQAPAKTPR
ncbi:hypothetical protein [Streptomyces tsukubensis]|uniref:hypothetical protein n=1 Tax=Streptomyces tsukubensis TaxID=83656 RepID=UPI00117FCEB1|nr:hypothetical protein [Streptomyces tsukubensis]QFR92693.1 hypothetical protein GBW32_05995 [Streptomyces tsukubensis]